MHNTIKELNDELHGQVGYTAKLYNPTIEHPSFAYYAKTLANKEPTKPGCLPKILGLAFIAICLKAFGTNPS